MLFSHHYNITGNKVWLGLNITPPCHSLQHLIHQGLVLANRAWEVTVVHPSTGPAPPFTTSLKGASTTIGCRGRRPAPSLVLAPQ
jgi:hypothetical protein